MEQSNCSQRTRRDLFVLTLGALGVVYGDIGTSPLYAVRECFFGPHGIAANPENILGVLSLIVWALILVVSIKYLIFVLCADNHGEGGNLALMALALPRRGEAASLSKIRLIEYLGLAGAALIYGDGVITPAISVLSAVEGLNVATPVFEPYIVFITVLVLFGLFFVQKIGTGKVGNIFGPVMIVWFLTIGVLGIGGIRQHPSVLLAVNPWYALQFLFTTGFHGFVVLGSVFLVATGAEALFADMGHFGRKSVRIGWFSLVLPGLLLNYFGQGALLLETPAHAENPFYLLAPDWARMPLVFLATLSTVIASQALISGAFSLTRQAVQLGYLPRLSIRHTSAKEIGQIYVPLVNSALLVSTVLLVVIFRSSSALASAYGIAVSTTMILTTTLLYFVVRDRWEWKRGSALALIFGFLAVDITFFSANLVKVQEGGWVPLALGAIVFLLMTTWKRGREILYNKLQALTPSLKTFLDDQVQDDKVQRVPGAAIFMTQNLERTPPALILNVRHNKTVHEQVVLLRVETEEVPHLQSGARVELQTIGKGFFTATLHFGFMETPNVMACMALLKQKGCHLNLIDTTFFLGRETLIATEDPGMAIWREQLFAFMSRNAQRAPTYFQIPAEQVVEIGFPLRI